MSSEVQQLNVINSNISLDMKFIEIEQEQLNKKIEGE